MNQQQVEQNQLKSLTRKGLLQRPNNFYLQLSVLLIHMRELDDFATPNPQPLFQEAEVLPIFFEHNLLDPARVVKVFKNDPQANIRVFYYQYLKLCFELESVNFQNYINRIQQVINNEDFKFVFYQDDDPEIFSDTQFKYLLTQLFGILGDGTTTVEDALSRFPIMDTVMIYFYRAILILTGKTQSLDSYIDRGELFPFLCQYFGVEISVHDKCIKFVQTDIFVYEQEPQQVFMAFMDYDKAPFEPTPEKQQQKQPNIYQQESSYQQEQSYVIPSVSIGQNNVKKEEIVSSSSRRGTTQMKESYISSDFVDYTSAASLITQNVLHSSGANDRNAQNNNNNVFNSTKIQPTTPQQSITNNHQHNNAFSQFESKPTPADTFKPAYQYNNYSSISSSLNEKSVHNTTGLGQEDSKLSYGGVSKFESSSYQKTFVPQVSKNMDPFYKKQFEKYSALSEFESIPSSLGIQQNYQQNSFTPYQPPATGDTYRTKQSSYTSNYSDTNKFIQTKPASSNLQNEYPGSKPASQISQNIYDVKPPSSQGNKGIASYQPNQYGGPQPLIAPTGKNPFGLNVSLEFTNSFTMKAMAEPFKTEVRAIRQRARNYRDSLVSFLK